MPHTHAFEPSAGYTVLVSPSAAELVHPLYSYNRSHTTSADLTSSTMIEVVKTLHRHRQHLSSHHHDALQSIVQTMTNTAQASALAIGPACALQRVSETLQGSHS